MSDSGLETKPHSTTEQSPTDQNRAVSSATAAAGTPTSLSLATAGQRAADTALRKSIDQQRPLVLFFGEPGVGKTTVIQRTLATVENEKRLTLYMSATGGDLIGRPTFDAFLEALAQRITICQLGRERPAKLAALTSLVASLASAGRTIVLAIDHADHLADTVISDLANLPAYLNAAPDNFVRIFVGSLGLASRLDAVVRRAGTPHRNFAEIRLPQPTIEEVAALLAYLDMAEPRGPMLTAGAIDRISTYAKSNLHWAVPLADAARALAEEHGDREVTPELIGGALLELWPPGQSEQTHADDPGAAGAPQGQAGIDGNGVSIPENSVASATTRGSPPTRPAEHAGESRKASGAWLPRWVWVAVAAFGLAAAVGFLANDRGVATRHEQLGIPMAGDPPLKPESDSPQSVTGPPSAGAEADASQQLPLEDAPPIIPNPPSPKSEETRTAPAPSSPAAQPASPATSASSTKAAAAKKAVAKPKMVRQRQEESRANQWIQHR